MKKRMLYFLLATIPVLLFAGVWQAFSFQNLEDEVRLMEAEQDQWFEQNKRKIIGIESLGAPRRLDQIAGEELGLEKGEGSDVIRIIVPQADNGGAE